MEESMKQSVEINRRNKVVKRKIGKICFVQKNRRLGVILLRRKK